MRVPNIFNRSLGTAIAVLLLAGLAAGCHSSGASTAITVTVTPTSANVALQGTQQFAASLTNATDDTVTWQVNMVTGGTTTCGTISANGFYTAPSVLPSSTACGTITITAISNEDTNAKGTATLTLTSGITISISPTGTLTMATGEHLGFVATVNGTGTTFVNTVNWLVNSTQGGSSTTGTICLTGTGPDLMMDATTPVACNPTTPGDGSTAAIYYAPGTIPSGTITIEAQSVADTTQTATATISLSPAAVPTVTAISPLLVPQGALFEDLYLTGTGFLSTTTVQFDGQLIPSTQISAASSTVLRVRVPSFLPGPAGASLLGIPGAHTISATQQVTSSGGGMGGSKQVTVVPVRPAGLSPIPASFTQQSPSSNQAPGIELDGGYYTQSSSLSYNGLVKSSALVLDSVTNLALVLGTGVTSLDPRRVSATIGGISSDVKTAGLFQVSVNTPNANPSQAAVNVSVTPNYAPPTPTFTPAVSNTITAQISTPVALGYDEVMGIPVVVNQGNNTLALLDSAFTTVIATIPVGMKPTGVAVDNLRHAALVVDNGSSDVQAVDLVGQVPVGAPVMIPSGQGPPFAAGMDNIHGLAIVVGQNANTATVLNTSGLPLVPPAIVGTVAVSTGASPQVEVLPELGWAIITAGGTGGVTVVDLVRSAAHGSTVILNAFLTPTPQGIALNTETKTLLLADPTISNAEVFRLTDQSVAGVNLGLGNIAAAVNPLTNIGIVLNPGLNQAFVLDLNSVTQATQSLTLGGHPIAVQFAADADKALVADDTHNSVTVIDFGPTRATGGDPQILAISRSNSVNIAASPNGAVESGNTVTIITSAAHGLTTGDSVLLSGVGVAGYNGMYVVTVTSPTQFTYTDSTSGLAASGGGTVLATAPNVLFTSSLPVPITVIGAGFAANSQIRLEGEGSPAVTTACVTPPLLPSPRMCTAMIPVSLLSGGPRRIIVDVLNPSTGALSNVRNLYLMQAVSVGHAPAGVAVGSVAVNNGTSSIDLAVVANSVDNTASFVDINPASPTFATVTATVSTGTSPAGVGILWNAGRVVVANSGEATASVIDATTSPPSVVGKVTLGQQPSGVAINEALGTAVVTSSGSNSVSVFDVTSSTLPQPSSLATGTLPVAAAVAPELGVAVVADETGNTAEVLNVSSGTLSLISSIPGLQEPFGVDYDPVTQNFLVLERAANEVLTINGVSLLESTFRAGVDCSSLAYDFQSGTLLTLNTASSTLSVVDLPNVTVTDLLPLTGSTQYALAIHPRLGLAVVSDSTNNRIVLMPMPR